MSKKDNEEMLMLPRGGDALAVNPIYTFAEKKTPVDSLWCRSDPGRPFGLVLDSQMGIPHPEAS